MTIANSILNKKSIALFLLSNISVFPLNIFENRVSNIGPIIKIGNLDSSYTL